jgi:hypothetical protein
MTHTVATDKTTDHSCLVTARWEWSDDVKSGRFSEQQQAYKRQRVYIPEDAADPFDDGFPVVMTKLKLRGKGKALQLKFESESGKDFVLYGWAIPFTGTGVA